MQPDLWLSYALMLKSRLFEEAIAKLWHDGLISGEMHLGTGEEAIVAGVAGQLKDGDAMALDHRGTAPMIMRGIDPALILHELLGSPEGLCGGMGGHTHLFSKKHLAASSGIVGASGPTAAGFALAAQYKNSGGVAVAFFGEGAMNQGMLMESMNLASAWNLPLIFVCKDDSWSITTNSEEMTGGDLSVRARGLGIPVVEADGRDVVKVWEAAHSAIDRARSGNGPTFLRANCVHFEGHFLGYQMIRLVRNPLKELAEIVLPIAGSIIKPGGASVRERLIGLKIVLRAVLSTMRDPRQDPLNDPVQLLRQKLSTDPEKLQNLEDHIELNVNDILASVLSEVSS